MFNCEEKAVADAAERRQRKVRLLSFGALTAVTIGVFTALFSGTQQNRDSDIAGIVRSGNSQYDVYRDKVQVEMIETIVHPNLIGMAQHEVRARISNLGDRSVTAVEIKGRMIGLDEATITTSTAYPIPRASTTPLLPGGTIGFSIKIDRPGNIGEELVKDHALEVTGIRF